MKKYQQVTFKIEGAKDGHMDGYLEMIIGFLAMSGMLKKHEIHKEFPQDGWIKLTMVAIVELPPLGGMGYDDIPEKGDEKQC